MDERKILHALDNISSAIEKISRELHRMNQNITKNEITEDTDNEDDQK
ncbi:MAG: hypothetical protein SPL82_05690 [Lachnospiraceae bacterium]|nr:hypothetical protein [Lachnospiraceae bacterium]